MKYASKPVPEGAKFRNAPLLAAGIGILRVCHLLPAIAINILNLVAKALVAPLWG